MGFVQNLHMEFTIAFKLTVLLSVLRLASLTVQVSFEAQPDCPTLKVRAFTRQTKHSKTAVFCMMKGHFRLSGSNKSSHLQLKMTRSVTVRLIPETGNIQC